MLLIPSWILLQVSLAAQMKPLARNFERQLQTQRQHSSGTANLGEWRQMLFAGDLRVGFQNTIAKRDPHNPRRDTDELNSSLLNGFDSSTENRTSFKLSGEKISVAPFLVKDDFSCPVRPLPTAGVLHFAIARRLLFVAAFRRGQVY
jgi:hypothetical protein